MECNKEEAIRAMQLAEKKMQASDFTGAQRIAQKARQLYPDLENISQLLTVCEVHCSAQIKLGGSEKDWYRILQVEQTVDAATIKKQYRKLAFLLHPDKNKFAGAEAAFKLIGEANSVLSDQSNRSSYDMKCRLFAKAAKPKPSVCQPKKNSFAQTQYGAVNNLRNQPGPQSTGWYWHQQAQSQTFWTCCPFCHMRFEYYRECINKALLCQSCRKEFVTVDLGTQGVQPGSFGQFPHQKQAPDQGPQKVPSQGNSTKFSGKRSLDASAGSQPTSKTGSESKREERDNGEVLQTKQGVGMPKDDTIKSKKTDSSKSSKRKRERKLVVESGESSETESKDDIMEDNGADSSTAKEGHHRRKSSRQKQNVSYKENLSDDDDDFVSLPKRSRVSKSSNASEESTEKAFENGGIANDDEREKQLKQSAGGPVEESLTSKTRKARESEVKGKEADISDHPDQKPKTDGGSYLKSNKTSILDNFSFPDPEFSDFDKDKAESCFAADQIWAIYDPVDGMPRYYARIRKVFSPGFRLKITWLEADPVNEAEIDWCDKELPVACGKYVLGNSQTVDHGMFSHQMQCIKGSGRNTYVVYPRKGETWAVFQNWDMNWSSDPHKHQPFQYEFVEVLSDFVEDAGVCVAYLARIKGFVSLFQQTEQHGVLSFQILTSELYRFSHRVPSFRLTGKERKGVPKGSYELDPASLPPSFFESGYHDNAKIDNGSISAGINVLCPEPQKVEAGDVSGRGEIPAAGKRERSSSRKETPLPRKSPRKSNISGQTGGSQGVSVESGMNGLDNGKVTPSKRSTSVCQSDEGINTPKKQGSNHETKAFEIRRSPRDVSKKKSEVNGNRPTKEEVATKQPHSQKDENSGFSSHTSSSSSAPKVFSRVNEQCNKSSARSPAAEAPVTPSRKLLQTECFDFTQQKSKEKFKVGQIWALRTDGDAMPTTYAQVKSIQHTPDFQVRVALLDSCSPSTDTSHPISCGDFYVKNKGTKAFSLSSFSHSVNATPKGMKRYEIYPRKGEIWALRKSQNGDLTCPSSSKGDCGIVEVLEDNEQSTKVVLLFHVNGSKSMFKAPRIQRSRTGVLEIPQAEMARFLHRIPAFQHTGESQSRLAGCWELDPSSIPTSVIRLD